MLSKSEQYEYLEKYCYRELCEKYGESKLASIFNLSLEEYVEWESQRPLSSFVNTSRDGYDGLYLLYEDGVWKVFWQERKIVHDFDLELFDKYLDARKYLASVQAPSFIKRRIKKAPNKTIKTEKTSWLRQIARFFRLS